MFSIIENKVIELLEESMINDVTTDVVVAVENSVLDWDKHEDYPRIVVSCTVYVPTSYQIGGGRLTKDYTVDIYILCSAETEAELVRQQEVLLERVETTLRNHQRLDNLADNDNKERVYSSSIDEVRINRMGLEGYFFGVVWLSFKVSVERVSI